MEYIYYVKQYLDLGFGIERIDEQAVFTTYQQAYNFIQENSFNEIEHYDEYKQKIIAMPIDSQEAYEDEKVWWFDIEGKELYQEPNNTIALAHNKAYIPIDKASIGDIVFLEAFPWNTNNYYTRNTVGIIGEYENEEYVLYIIEENRIKHLHLHFDALSVYDGPIPHAIQLLSKIIKKELKVSDKVFKELINGTILITDEKRIIDVVHKLGSR